VANGGAPGVGGVLGVGGGGEQEECGEEATRARYHGGFYSNAVATGVAMVAASLNPVAEQIVGFLREIGLGVRFDALTGETFLPGVALEPGGLVVDPERLRYPGDLLHEAGHLAVLTAAERAAAGGNVGTDMGGEIGAQCWSYAAAVHLGLAPEVVFHSDGYRGSAESLIGIYRDGNAGVPLLQWMGMTFDVKHAAESGAEPYPKMVRWLRE